MEIRPPDAQLVEEPPALPKPDSPPFAKRFAGWSVVVAIMVAVIVAGFSAISPVKAQLGGAVLMTVGNLVAYIPKATLLKWPLAHAAFVVLRLIAFNVLVLAAFYWVGRGAGALFSEVVAR